MIYPRQPLIWGNFIVEIKYYKSKSVFNVIYLRILFHLISHINRLDTCRSPSHYPPGH